MYYERITTAVFKFTRQGPDRPYAPFLPAVERGDVQLDELNIRRLEAPLGQMLINGRIPQQNDAGVVEVALAS